jgi:8-oxo-dGTP pyrophosphatase MutT (NUDIX family)
VTRFPYLGAVLRPEDEAGFKSAGVLLCCVIGGRPQVLLGRQSLTGCTLTLLGGKRDASTDGSLATALREFHEETAQQLERSRPVEQGWLAGALSTSGTVAWLGGKKTNSKYALYLVDATESDNASLNSVCDRFATLRKSPVWHRLPKEFKEMRQLIWVPLDNTNVLAAPVSSLSPFLRTVLEECEPLRSSAADMPAQTTAA